MSYHNQSQIEKRAAKKKVNRMERRAIKQSPEREIDREWHHSQCGNETFINKRGSRK